MGRLPFDPARMKASEQAARAERASQADRASQAAASGPMGVGGAAGAEAPPLSVSQLAASIDGALRAGVPRPVRVIGEVSNFTDRTHWYFALKDASAVVSCVMFQFAARKAGFMPQVGHEVVATGQVELYAPQGRLTLRVEKLEPVGAGALELEFRRLCEEIRALGWFDEGRKRALPAMPRRLAVVTSRTGAAIQDVLDTIRRRAPFVEVCLVDTLVQGAQAAPEIARAIDWVSASAGRLGLDTLIVTRGGGSMEDLWAFNERIVAEAIVRCSIPVAAAIGHETDTTIAELVADARCATPTQAAMRCTPDGAALTEQVDAFAQRLAAGLRSSVARARQSALAHARHLATAERERTSRAGRALEQAAARLERHRPAAVYERRRQRLKQAVLELERALRQRLADLDASVLEAKLEMAWRVGAARRTERLISLERGLELVGPASVLARGYSITCGPDGAPIRRAEEVRPGDALTTKLAEGTVNSTVSGLAEVRKRHGERRRTPKGDDKTQPGLFGE